jgi:hypothetical protein
MSQHHSGNVQPSLDVEEHDHLPGKVAVKKVGQYIWKDNDWQRQSEVATEATLEKTVGFAKNADLTITPSEDTTNKYWVKTDGVKTLTITKNKTTGVVTKVWND